MSKKPFFAGQAISIAEGAAILGISPDLLRIWVNCFGSNETEEPVLYPDDIARYRLLVQQMRESGFMVISRATIEDMEKEFQEMKERNIDVLRQLRSYLNAVKEEQTK